ATCFLAPSSWATCSIPAETASEAGWLLSVLLASWEVPVEEGTEETRMPEDKSKGSAGLFSLGTRPAAMLIFGAFFFFLGAAAFLGETRPADRSILGLSASDIITRQPRS